MVFFCKEKKTTTWMVKFIFHLLAILLPIKRRQHGEGYNKRADSTKFNTNLTVQALPSLCPFTDLDENLIKNSDFMEAFVSMKFF